MKIDAYLFDARGNNEKIEFTGDICERLNEKQLLWVSVLERSRDAVESVVEKLNFKKAPIEDIVDDNERPHLEKYEGFYRMPVNSVCFDKKGNVKRLPIDLLVAKNIVVTVQDGEAEYFKEFRDLEAGERHIGEMDAEGFISTLLDMHVISYYRVVEEIERRIDRFDEKILTSKLNDEDFFAQMLKLRRDVSKLRKWLMPHRDVFYALSRPDFVRIAESDSAEHFQHLNEHFEGAMNAVESSREVVLSLFDLYATRASHRMNDLMKRLTFVTIVFGALSVIVGAFGMNFETGFFKIADGFWLTIIGMGVLSLILLALAKFKDWV